MENKNFNPNTNQSINQEDDKINNCKISICDCDDCLSGRYNPNDYVIDEEEYLKLGNDRPIGLTGHLRAKNEALTIAECIESCIDFLDELIITYNDSEDETGEIIRKHEKIYPNKIRAFHYKPTVTPYTYFHRNRNLSETFKYPDANNIHNPANYCNFGYTKISYKYYVKIDADQIYFTDKMIEIRNMLVNNEFKNDNLEEYFNKYDNSSSEFRLVLGGVNLTKNLFSLEASTFYNPFNGCVGDHSIIIPNTNMKYHFSKEKKGELFGNPPSKLMSIGLCWLHFGLAKSVIQGCEVNITERGWDLREFASLSWKQLLANKDFTTTFNKLKRYKTYAKMGENWWDNDRKYILKMFQSVDFEKIQSYYKSKVKTLNVTKELSSTTLQSKTQLKEQEQVLDLKENIKQVVIQMGLQDAHKRLARQTEDKFTIVRNVVTNIDNKNDVINKKLQDKCDELEKKVIILEDKLKKIENNYQ